VAVKRRLEPGQAKTKAESCIG